MGTSDNTGLTAIPHRINSAIQTASLPIASFFGLEKLTEHAHLIIYSALLFWVIHKVVAPIVSRALFPGVYSTLNKRDRNNWNNRIASLLHALLIIPLAIRCLNSAVQEADKAFGWDPRSGLTMSVACGYFLWDTFESSLHLNEWGFVLHAFMCFAIFFLSFKPFIAYYAPRFLLWELSTPFVNIHWFLDKSRKTGSTLQLVNGIALLTTFAGVRLLYGTKMSLQFWRTMLYDTGKDEDLPVFVPLVYCAGNLILSGLNWFWFYKMIGALQRRRKGVKKGKV